MAILKNKFGSKKIKSVLNSQLEPILPNFVFLWFPIFAVKFGYFIVNTLFSYVCYKYSSLTSKNGNFLHFRRKKVWYNQLLLVRCYNLGSVIFRYDVYCDNASVKNLRQISLFGLNLFYRIASWVTVGLT